jgi:hypothetical protein
MRDTPFNAYEEDVTNIVAICKKYFGSKITIVLYGSYGRDEGGWIVDGFGDYQPYNDYDLIVLKEKFEKKDSLVLSEVVDELKSRIKVKFIDLTLKELKDFKIFKPSVLNFDMQNHNKILYGNENVFSVLPKLATKSLSLKEVEILFFTRLWIFSGGVIDVCKDRVFCLNQLAKAVLACVDAILLENQLYKTKYEEKVVALEEMPVDGLIDLQLVKWAVMQKLHPGHGDSYQSIEEITILQEEVANVFSRVFLAALSKHHNKKFPLVASFMETYKNSLYQRIKLLCYPLLRGTNAFSVVFYSNIIFLYQLSVILNKKNLQSFDVELNTPLKKLGVNEKTYVDMLNKVSGLRASL